MIKTAVPRALSISIILTRLSQPSASRPSSGLSKQMHSGESAKTAAIATRRCSPRLSVRGSRPE
ncbi:MAG TPA: hypothetical protein DCY85_03185 [Firmicutes bacterium]|nr:hypothetical protein [Bacillota bacterium]HCF88570.1 hypothetical protein [Bacillota bacterium]